MQKVLFFPLVFLLISFVPANVAAEPLTIITWNVEGPGGLADKDLSALGDFIENADVVVIEEVLGADQLEATMIGASVETWNSAVSNFAKDSFSDPFKKQELGVITPHAIGTVREVDPWPNDDTPEMREEDEDFDVPNWMPEDQRNRKGARGWLWVEIPSLKLVVVAVHLKSSRGMKGKPDEQNSFKREAVLSALGVIIREDSTDRSDWSYVVAGDFNVAPGDSYKMGVDLNRRCGEQNDCRYYDQSHSLLGAGLVHGLTMRNLTEGLSASYAGGAFVDSPIDNIYALGPIFDQTTKMTLERGDHFGADHYAVKVSVE